MNLSKDEINLVRQWFNAVQDLNPGYLEPVDYQLQRKILARLGAPAGDSYWHPDEPRPEPGISRQIPGQIRGGEVE